MAPDIVSIAGDKLNIEIAGLTTRILLNKVPEVVRYNLVEKYNAFRVNNYNQIVTISIFMEEGGHIIPIDSNPWRILTKETGRRIEFTSHYERGWFDLETGRGKLYIRPQGDPENYLRVLYAWRCLEQGALLLHASGVIRDERGFVFFGPSGSGKTTITRFAEGGLILSDDLVILKWEEVEGKPSVRVYGVPFRGEMAEAARCNASAPLAGLFSLVKDDNHSLLEVSPRDATGNLAASVPFVMNQPASATRALALCAEISNRIRVGELHFRRDPGFWDLIDA